MNAAPFTACLTACALLAAAPLAAQESIQLETTNLAASGQTTPDSVVVIRHPWLNAYVHGDAIDPQVSTAPPRTLVLNRLELARPWIQLLSDDDLNEDWEASACRDGEGGFCNLRWRKTNALSAARSRLDEMSHGFKSRLVGKSLARHLEIDIDSSPEIKFEWEFD